MIHMSYCHWKVFLEDKYVRLACVFSSTHPVVSVGALPSGSLHILSFAFCLSIKKTSSELIADRWVIEELTADDRHKKANPQNYSQPLSRLLCNLFFFFFFFSLPHAVWLEACLECLARGLLITSAAASIRPSPWLQGCCWAGWAFQSYPLSPGAFTLAMHCSISCRCTQTECAVKWVLYFPRVGSLSPSSFRFLRQN